MEMPMTAVSDVTAAVAGGATGGAGAASGSATPVQTGGNARFGKLFAELTVPAGQNAETAATVGQSIDSLVAVLQPAQTPQLAASVAVTDQKGSAKTVAGEDGHSLADQEAALAAQLVAALGAVAAGPLPAAVAATDSPKDRPAEPKEQQTAVGAVNAHVSSMLQSLQQPKPANPLPGQQPAASLVTATNADVGQQQSAVVSAPGEPFQGAVQVVPQQSAVKLSTPAVDQQASLATDQAAVKAPGRLHDAKPAERGAWRSKLAEQGVTAETVSAGQSTDRPAKIDLGFTDVVIRDAADPTEAVRPNPVAATTSEGKAPHANPLSAQAPEGTDPNRSVQPGSPEPAKPVSHEQIVSQVREKLATVDPRDNGQVVLRLHPEELGELKIDVRMENQRLRVDIVTESPTVKEALLANMNSLREVLAKHNIAMDRFDVSTGGSGFQQAFRDGRAWEQQNGAFNRTPGKWSLGGDSQPVVAAAAHYARNPEYGMVDVRF
jgi:flagellar hook-length control protein FliK